MKPRKINGCNLRIQAWNKGQSCSKASFSGAMLIFRGVNPMLSEGGRVGWLVVMKHLQIDLPNLTRHLRLWRKQFLWFAIISAHLVWLLVKSYPLQKWTAGTSKSAFLKKKETKGKSASKAPLFGVPCEFSRVYIIVFKVGGKQPPTSSSYRGEDSSWSSWVMGFPGHSSWV